MNLAIIPARGGSKRIPRKNIKPFCGKPMISYAITAAIESGIFDHIVVSTEDAEIADISVGLGAIVPFDRPPDLADDYTTTAPVVKHAINSCKSLGMKFAYVCCIYPCVPFIDVNDLKASLQLLKEVAADFCLPVAQYPSPIYRALRRQEDGMLSPIYPEYELTRTQDLESAYYDAGQFYWGSVHAWLSNSRIHSEAVGLRIPAWKVVDIDTHEDWERAERLSEAFLNRDRHD